MARTRASEREREETRARILLHAHAEFTRRGYRGSSIDAIAVGAGLTRQGVLHHFPSKQALLLALLDERDQQLGNMPDRVDDSAAAFLDTARSTISQILAQRELVALAHALSAEAVGVEHPAHDWLVRRYDGLRSAFTDAFVLSFERGELAPRADPRVLAALVLGATEGLEAQWLAHPEAVNVEEGIALLHAMIFDYLRT
ncbi:TetR/AcrR family transcriptional regulator [Glaciihabitans sp. dw_435]|uniref:TetR/AcrR family transcriptional regulator n=1 Tax=Glaciihabitans sp. dw_435 TaxID=2720081 RepID=UPI001BD33CD3|nr:TetR/AcrR family transcriptional regulator [Glaciihabitans sp. dw_435]